MSKMVLPHSAPILLTYFWCEYGKNASSDMYLVQLIEHPILRIPNFNFPNLRCCKLFFLFNIKSYIGIFGYTYLDINLKVLSGKNNQKVNKQKIRDS